MDRSVAGTCEESSLCLLTESPRVKYLENVHHWAYGLAAAAAAAAAFFVVEVEVEVVVVVAFVVVVVDVYVLWTFESLTCPSSAAEHRGH